VKGKQLTGAAKRAMPTVNCSRAFACRVLLRAPGTATHGFSL